MHVAIFMLGQKSVQSKGNFDKIYYSINYKCLIHSNEIHTEKHVKRHVLCTRVTEASLLANIIIFRKLANTNQPQIL